MRCIPRQLKIILVLVLCLAFGNTATIHAVNNSVWFQNRVETRTSRYADFYKRGQCYGRTIDYYDYSSKKYGFKFVCISDTVWGSITRDGYIQTGYSYTGYHRVDLPVGARLLFAPNSDKLYFSVPASSGNFKVAYINNPKTSLAFNEVTRMYNLPQVYPYLTGEFSSVGFSNDSGYMIGITTDNYLQRTLLLNMSHERIKWLNFGNIVASPEYMAISDDGSLVAVASKTSMAVYDFGGCEESGKSFCQSRLLSSSINIQEGIESVFIGDYKSVLYILSNPSGGNVTQMVFELVPEIRHVSYIALGDSFSSGEGARDYINETDGSSEYPKEKCHQSYSSYPFYYWGAYRGYYDRGGSRSSSINGMRIQSFIFAACSGAEIKHVRGSSRGYPGQFDQFKVVISEDDAVNIMSQAVENQIPGRALQRDFLAHYKPTIATIGIGGNDIGFGNILTSCISTPGTCREASSDLGRSGKKIHDSFNTLVDTFTDLHAASPNTRLYAVGYPIIAKGEGGLLCDLSTLLNKNERALIGESTKYLNDVIEAAAKKAGIGYIDIENALGGSILCGSGTRGVNGLSMGDDIELPYLSLKMIGQESYHPNEYGQGLTGDLIVSKYGELDNYPNKNCPDSSSGYCPNASVKAPAIPAFFGASSRNLPDVVQYKNDMTEPFTANNIIKIIINGLLKFSPLKGTIFSDPQSIGTYQVGEDGTFNQTIKLPENLEPGYHTIYFTGTLANGETFEYSQVILYLPPETKTGPCGIMPYSNIDQDADGIDDACDPSVDVDEPLKIEDPDTVLIYPNQGNATSAGIKSGEGASGSAAATDLAKADPVVTAAASLLKLGALSDSVGATETTNEVSNQPNRDENSTWPWGLTIALIIIVIVGGISIFAVQRRLKRAH